MKISKLTDYAGMILQFLAQRDCQALSASTIAQALPIQLPTTRKVLKRLAKANLVSSTLGKDGGYTLARDPRSISLADMVMAMEGLDLTACTTGCERTELCAVRGHWRRINEVIAETLQQVSLSDLAQPAAVCLHKTNSKKIITIEETS